MTWPSDTRFMLDHIPQFPHCDQRVLHRPGECEFCDRRPEWQALRMAWGIAFTGEPTHTDRPIQCPAEQARPLGTLEKWGGNRPRKDPRAELEASVAAARAREETSRVQDLAGAAYQKIIDDAAARVTASGRPPVEPASASAPDLATLPDGQHRDHWVLSDDERAKGFLRPVRTSYRHVGPRGPIHPVRNLTDDERERFADVGYVKFEIYPESKAPLTGRYWTHEQLDQVKRGACGTVTTMGRAIAETYAREPRFYGSTFCCGCGKYFRVGEDGEFTWTGTDERVGT